MSLCAQGCRLTVTTLSTNGQFRIEAAYLCGIIRSAWFQADGDDGGRRGTGGNTEHLDEADVLLVVHHLTVQGNVRCSVQTHDI